MLLRLLPIPTASQPTPPTILFTLPLPNHPYTSKSLPLPPNLLAHRSVCLQEDLECSNVLLGEKSSWVAGIIDDVTFSLPDDMVTIHLIDGQIITFPLSSECTQSLRRVIHEVQLSFAPPPPTAAEASPRTSTSSIASTSSASSSYSVTEVARKRSPSALLLSILSPLLPGVSATLSSPTRASFPAPAPQQPARIHRRQARSLLVDTYRRHVLPALKERLESAYLPWAIATETSRKMAEFEVLRQDINILLANAGIDPSTCTPLKRTRSVSTASSRSDSDSDDDSLSPFTPATSVFSPSACCTPRNTSPLNPQSFLLSIPPAHAVPFAHRNGYSAQLAQLTKIASRLSAIKKLQSRYDREEGKRRWLDSLERGRQGDRALRRAFSNGLIRAQPTANAQPIKRSNLWRSWSANDQERIEVSHIESIHPAMMSPVSEASSLSDEEEQRSLSIVTAAPPRRRSASSISLPNLPDLTLEDDIDVVTDKLIVVQHGVAHRPPLVHRGAAEDVPSLMTSLSDESLAESEEWDEEAKSPTDDTPSIQRATRGLLPPPPIPAKWDVNVVSMTTPLFKPDMRFGSWDESAQDPDVHVEVHGNVGIVYA